MLFFAHDPNISPQPYAPNTHTHTHIRPSLLRRQHIYLALKWLTILLYNNLFAKKSVRVLHALGFVVIFYNLRYVPQIYIVQGVELLSCSALEHVVNVEQKTKKI